MRSVDITAERCRLTFEVVRRAADTSPEVADLWDRTQRNRRGGARMVVDVTARLAARMQDALLDA